MPEYIDREAAAQILRKEAANHYPTPFHVGLLAAARAIDAIPAADVLPRDEAITMGAELAAMHGSDATSQQLEEAYLQGVEDGMTRRDVRPVVRAKWSCKRTNEHDGDWYCTACNKELTIYMGNREDRYAFCPNCGAVMEES